MSSGVRNTTATRRASVRPAPVTKRASSARPPMHAASASLSRLDRPSAFSRPPSVMSNHGLKRKERDFEHGPAGDLGEATNINVVVRCRGRNEREVSENSAVVVGTDGTRGKSVELIMGPNSMSNKSYGFDRVFSQAADQSMVFEDVVRPMLDEMLAGFNCTIFAYGQTGTGKTYTMSGDMTETMGILSDAAGIIPRVLQSLFGRLEADKTEHCVRCSFIELYNEELRDLLTPDENAKLKIFDDNSKKGQTTVMVQGMEERHIKTAAEGIKRLQEGSMRRQVAATKCNDLSSRSHTVFTITVHAKQDGENGEEFISLGKLNLVDLAGSENIQRSGAENKRAAEAGLINKSLLTLGRVINALVDRSPHIPYRESKLTRLLQDSLGGRTKTCIIATLSPARSNLEETISTLDYAFRAKNIRNKPQTNSLVNKKTLLSEFTAEIEKLKSDLIATRLRNGVHLSCEAYEEMTLQSESRRILAAEQAAKMETVEANLRNKVQELFALTSSFMGLKKDHEGTRMALAEARDVLSQMELVLASTRQALQEETEARDAHQQTEAQLINIGGQLVATLDRTVEDVNGLRAKDQRRLDLHNVNHDRWTQSQQEVAEITKSVEGQIEALHGAQATLIASVHARFDEFVNSQSSIFIDARKDLQQCISKIDMQSKDLEVESQDHQAHVQESFKNLETITYDMSHSWRSLIKSSSDKAASFAKRSQQELENLADHLHSSCAEMQRDISIRFEEMARERQSQQEHIDRLTSQLKEATHTVSDVALSAAGQIRTAVESARAQALEERSHLITQITDLVEKQSSRHEARLVEEATMIAGKLITADGAFKEQLHGHFQGMEASRIMSNRLADTMATIKSDLSWSTETAMKKSEDKHLLIRRLATETHGGHLADLHLQQVDVKEHVKSLDSYTRDAKAAARAHNNRCTEFLSTISKNVSENSTAVDYLLQGAHERVRDFAVNAKTQVDALDRSVQTINALGQPLESLRKHVVATAMLGYVPTGETPARVQYTYPREMPTTYLAGEHGQDTATPSRRSMAPPPMPEDNYMDDVTPSSSRTAMEPASPEPAATLSMSPPHPSPRTTLSTLSHSINHDRETNSTRSHFENNTLREIDPNIVPAIAINPPSEGISIKEEEGGPARKKARKSLGNSENIGTVVTSGLPRLSSRGGKKRKSGGGGGGGGSAEGMLPGTLAEGRENIPLSASVSGQSIGRRRSPRTLE